MTAATGAYLRLVFKEAAERAFQIGRLSVSKHPSKVEVAWMGEWAKLYEAVRDADDGALEMLREIQLLNDRIQALEEEAARLRGQLPRPAALPVKPDGDAP